MDDEDYNFKSKFNERYSIVSRKIIRALSENSRCSVSELSRNLKISRKLISMRMSRLEQELGIKYVLQLNEDRLGFLNQHVIIAKFGLAPDPSMLKKLIERSYIPQLAVQVANGTFDLLIYANAASRQEYVRWDKGMQLALADYGVDWKSSEVAHRQLGFFPMRNELLEKAGIKSKYLDMLKMLNNDSRATFKDISRRLGIHFNTAAYTFGKLVSMGYINKFTLSLEIPKDITLMTHFGKYVIPRSFEDDANRIRQVYKSDDQYSLISRYLLCAQLVGSYDFMAIGAFDDYDTAYKWQVKHYKKVMKAEQVKVEFGKIKSILVGKLPLRSIDNKKEYDAIRWTQDF